MKIGPRPRLRAATIETILAGEKWGRPDSAKSRRAPATKQQLKDRVCGRKNQGPYSRNRVWGRVFVLPELPWLQPGSHVQVPRPAKSHISTYHRGICKNLSVVHLASKMPELRSPIHRLATLLPCLTNATSSRRSTGSVAFFWVTRPPTGKQSKIRIVRRSTKRRLGEENRRPLWLPVPCGDG